LLKLFRTVTDKNLYYFSHRNFKVFYKNNYKKQSIVIK